MRIPRVRNRNVALSLEKFFDFAVGFGQDSSERCGGEGIAGIKGEEENGCGAGDTVRLVVCGGPKGIC